MGASKSKSRRKTDDGELSKSRGQSRLRRQVRAQEFDCRPHGGCSNGQAHQSRPLLEVYPGRGWERQRNQQAGRTKVTKSAVVLWLALRLRLRASLRQSGIDLFSGLPRVALPRSHPNKRKFGACWGPRCRCTRGYDCAALRAGLLRPKQKRHNCQNQANAGHGICGPLVSSRSSSCLNPIDVCRGRSGVNLLRWFQESPKWERQTKGAGGNIRNLKRTFRRTYRRGYHTQHYDIKIVI